MAVRSKSREDTLRLGEMLGQSLVPGDIVLLFGDLGAGKTTFTQGVCQGLGLPENEYVRSPSFTLINEYRGRCPIFHVDLYRLETARDIEQLGLEEVLFGNGITIVEWAERLAFSDPTAASPGYGIEARVEVRIGFGEENHRVFDIRPVGLKDREFPVFALQ